MRSRPSDGWLIPARYAAFVRRDADSIDLVDVENGWSGHVSGAMAEAVTASIEQDALHPRLAALGSDHPIVRMLVSSFGESAIAAAPQHALALNRWQLLFVELLGACNERCLHCYAESAPQVTGHLTQIEVEAIIQDAKLLGFEGIQFTGGDPLLCPFLVQAVAAARAAGIEMVEIFTNGMLLREELLQRLKEYEPSFAVSVYSADMAVHDKITRTVGSWQRTVEGLKRAIASGFSVRAAVIEMPENQSTIEETIALLKNLGIDRIGLSHMHGVGRGTYHQQIHSSASAGNSVHGAQQSSSVGGKLCVSYEGNVLPCIFNRTRRLGSIRERRLATIVHSPTLTADRGETTIESHLQESRQTLQCGSCQLTESVLYALAPQ